VKKYISVIAAIIVQIALGGIYAYSIYVPSFNQQWGYSSAQTQLVFGVTVLLFTVFMIYSGKKLIKYGPRRLIIISALLFSLGHFLVAASSGNFALFAMGYWLFIAPSISFGYVCAVSTGLLWFPGHKGLVTGLAVAGYGAGGVILSGVAEYLLNANWSIQQVLAFVGITWGTAIFLSGLASSTPPNLIKKHSKYSAKRVIIRYKKEFTALTLYLFTGTMPGLMMIGALKPFALFNGIATATAASGVALLAIGNGAGRVSWGQLSDKIAPRKIVVINMIGIILSMVMLFFVKDAVWMYLPASFILGFCFGGPLVLAPNQIGRVFGSNHLSLVYPWALLFHGFAAAIGASLAGVIFQSTNSYTPVLIIAASTAAVGLVAYYNLVKNSYKLKKV
jgi:OFA family oxalate/formate antiporter-like MFS transporter